MISSLIVHQQSILFIFQRITQLQGKRLLMHKFIEEYILEKENDNKK
jgi:hypothetical protein